MKSKKEFKISLAQGDIINNEVKITLVMGNSTLEKINHSEIKVLSIRYKWRGWKNPFSFYKGILLLVKQTKVEEYTED